MESTPFFIKDVALGDIVSAERTKEDWYRFERIISRSGNSNFRIWLDDTVAHDGDKIAQELRELGCKVEITLERLITLRSRLMSQRIVSLTCGTIFRPDKPKNGGKSKWDSHLTEGYGSCLLIRSL